MKIIFLVLTVVILFSANSIAHTQKDDSLRLVEVEFVLRSASHGFRWRVTNPEPKVIYDSIIAAPASYHHLFNILADKYLTQGNVKLLNRLTSLMINTNDNTNAPIIGQLLWQYENTLIPKLVDSMDSYTISRYFSDIKNVQSRMLAFLVDKNHKDEAVKCFCLYSLNDKANVTLFRNSMQYLAHFYHDDDLLRCQLDLLMVEKKFHEIQSLEALYHELFY